MHGIYAGIGLGILFIIFEIIVEFGKKDEPTTDAPEPKGKDDK